MQTETDKEREGWETVSIIKATWCYENAGFELTLRILEKDGKYLLMLNQPANMTEDTYFELSGRPIKWLAELEELPYTQYKYLVGALNYGETCMSDIATFLGTSVGSYFYRSNIS